MALPIILENIPCALRKKVYSVIGWDDIKYLLGMVELYFNSSISSLTYCVVVITIESGIWVSSN